MRSNVYVETVIRTDMDTLWKYTQEPDLHQAWDLRFSEINYVPKQNPQDEQRFTYKTRIGFGVDICGEGLSRGHMEQSNGGRVSALSFSSDQRRSLIRQGSGYWRYIPEEGQVRFLTRYDYETRWGIAGQLIDRFCFRPLIGWATAWSFDALRLWLEKGIHPTVTKMRSVIHALICFALAVSWVYQGLVPKLLFPQTGEVAIVQASGWFSGYELLFVTFTGVGQIILGSLFLLPIAKRELFYFSIAFIVVLGIAALLSNPSLYLQPFNPVVASAALIAVCIIGIFNAKNLAQARRCVRREKGSTAQ